MAGPAGPIQRVDAGAQIAKVVKAGSDVLIEAVGIHGAPEVALMGPQTPRPVRVPGPTRREAVRPGWRQVCG